MKNLIRTAAAGVIALWTVSPALAGTALEDLGARRASAAPAAVQAAPAEAVRAPDIDIFQYFGHAQVLKSGEIPLADKAVKGPSDPVLSVQLEPLRNAYLKPNISFAAGGGTTVFVSGTKASNCPDGGNSCLDKEKFFLVLTTDKNESFFVRAMEILNWGIFMSGSRAVTIGGEKYTVKVYANASTPENSRLEIRGSRGVVLNSDLKRIGDAVAEKGVDVRLSRAYKLAYGNEIVQGPHGAKFTDKMLVLLLPYPVVNASTYYVFPAAEIKPAGSAFPDFETGYGFKLHGGKLDIYRI